MMSSSLLGTASNLYPVFLSLGGNLGLYAFSKIDLLKEESERFVSSFSTIITRWPKLNTKPKPKRLNTKPNHFIKTFTRLELIQRVCSFLINPGDKVSTLYCILIGSFPNKYFYIHLFTVNNITFEP